MYLQWTHLLPEGGYTVTQKGAGNRLLVDAYAPEPPPEPPDPPPPEPEPVTGRVVSGAIFFDVDLDAWVLEDVKVEPIL
jgi:hypothetical protein